MVKLLVQFNSLDYVARLERPVTELWGREDEVLGALYDVFAEFGIDLDDMGFVEPAESVADYGIKVNWGGRSKFSLHLDRVEAHLENYGPNDLALLPDYIARGERAIRKLAPHAAYSTRTVSAANHARFDSGTADDLLRSLGTRSLHIEGVTRPSGVTFHFAIPDRRATMDLLLDHSLAVPSGLFIMSTVSMAGDTIDHGEALTWWRDTIAGLLAQIGLEYAIPEGSQ